MTKETKEHLLNLLQDISYGFDAYQDDIENEGYEFWGAWSAMHQYISNLTIDS